MHLRPPSIDHGFASFLWGFGLGVYLWFGMLLIGISGATAFIGGALGGAAIFLFVRQFGQEDVQPRSRRSRIR